jgi:hypothetical protein
VKSPLAITEMRSKAFDCRDLYRSKSRAERDAMVASGGSLKRSSPPDGRGSKH